MLIENVNGNIRLKAETGKKIISKNNPNKFYSTLYLGLNDDVQNYMEIKDENYKIVIPPDTTSYDLEVAKEEKIKESKDKLSNYLLDNPLYSYCHKNIGAYYTVTAEKQLLLSSKIASYRAKKDLGIEDSILWNATGQISEPWTYNECIELINEIDSYITPLILKQQNIEIQIKKAKTITELAKINLSFS